MESAQGDEKGFDRSRRFSLYCMVRVLGWRARGTEVELSESFDTKVSVVGDHDKSEHN